MGPMAVLEAQVFNPCPPTDYMAMERSLDDLGAALHIWTGLGLWKSAVGQVIRDVVPLGPIQAMALQDLQDRFSALDTQKIGVLQPPAVVALVHQLANPGL